MPPALGIIAYLILSAIGLFGFGVLFFLSGPTDRKLTHPYDMIVFEAGLGAIALVVNGVMAHVERRGWSEYGYAPRGALKLLLQGLGFGFAEYSAIVAIQWATGHLSLDGLNLHGVDIWKYGALWGSFTLLVGITEESAFRGYLQATLRRGIGFWGAAIVMAILFGCAHLPNGGMTVRDVLEISGLGLFAALSVRATGSLWWAVGAHAAYDWSIFFFYGTGYYDHYPYPLIASHPIGSELLSGGTSGPESSIVGMITEFAIWGAALYYWHRKTAKQSQAPP